MHGSMRIWSNADSSTNGTHPTVIFIHTRFHASEDYWCCAFIATEPANAVPMEIDNLCEICNQFYTGPYASCGCCNQSPSDHHGGCCLEKPAFLRGRTQQPQPPWGRFPDFQPAPVPVKSQGHVSFTDRAEPMVTWLK